MTRLPLPLALALSAGLTACGGDSPARATAEQWTSALCTALTPLVTQSEELQKALQTKAAAISSDPAGVKTAFGTALTATQDALEAGIAAAEEAGVPDVEDGEQVQEDTLASLRAAAATIQAGRDKLEGVATTPEAVRKAFVDISADISDGFGKTNETFDRLDGNEELATAGDANPDCKALNDS